jgi:hypothetical protein
MLGLPQACTHPDAEEAWEGEIVEAVARLEEIGDAVDGEVSQLQLLLLLQLLGVPSRRREPHAHAAIRSAVPTERHQSGGSCAELRRNAKPGTSAVERGQPTAARHSCGMLTCSPVTRPEL